MSAPSTLDRLRGRLTGTDPRVYATRREAGRDLVALRDRERRVVQRLQEQSIAFDSYPFLYQRFADGDPGLLPYGWFGSGTLTDRKGGKDVPVFWTELDLRQFRWMSRLLCETNPFAIGFLGLLVDFHVRGGYGWSACLRGVKKTPYATADADADPLVKAAQEVLDEFRDGEPGSLTGSWSLRSREAFARLRRDGEVFLRFFPGGPATRGVPTCRFVAPEQVGSPAGDTSGPASFGVLTDPDDVETVLAYFVRDPDGTGQEGEWVTANRAVDVELVRRLTGDGYRVVRGEMLHLKANADANVKRGLPDFFPVREELEAVRRLLHNMTLVAALQAAIGWVEQWAVANPEVVARQIAAGEDYTRLKTNQPFGQIGFGGRTASVTNYEPGSILKIDQNRNLIPGPVAAGVPGFVQAVQASLRGCGARWRLPEYFSGDASNNNLASSQVAGSPFVAAVEGGQLAWGALERAAAMKVIELAVASRRLPPEALRRLDVEATAPKVVLDDKEELARVRSQQLKDKTISPQEVILEDGRDPKHVAENWKAWRQLFPDQGFGAQPGEDGFGGGGGSGGGGDPGGGGESGPPVRESADASGHEHKGKGPGGGQFTSKGGKGGAGGRRGAPEKRPAAAAAPDPPPDRVRDAAALTAAVRRGLDGEDDPRGDRGKVDPGEAAAFARAAHEYLAGHHAGEFGVPLPELYERVGVPAGLSPTEFRAALLAADDAGTLRLGVMNRTAAEQPRPDLLPVIGAKPMGFARVGRPPAGGGA